MGAQNVARALHSWGPELDPRPLLILVRMAVTALDGDAAPWFEGGWDLLARAAGHVAPAGCERCRGCKACAAPRKSVQRAVAGLVAAGAIVRTRPPSRHRPARYRLYLDGPAPVEKIRQTELFLGDGEGDAGR